MPFFSSFTGSKTAGRRSDGVQNNPQGSAENRGDPVTPAEKAVWLHLTANQAGVTPSNYNFGDSNSSDYQATTNEPEDTIRSGFRRVTHTARGLQTIVDNSIYNAVRANTAGEQITTPNGKTLSPSLAVSNSVSNINKTEILARYGSTANNHYNPANIERDGYNDHWIDLRGDAQTNLSISGAAGSLAAGTDGQIEMCRNSDNSPSNQTAWSMHTNPSEQGFVPAGNHDIETSSGKGTSLMDIHVGFRPFCLEAWIFTPGPFTLGTNPSNVSLFKLGSGSVWDLAICTYDNSAPTKTDGGWEPYGVNSAAAGRYALPRFLNGGTNQLNAGTANTDVLQAARMDCQQWNHIAWVRTAWGEFGDMVLFANGIEIYRASYEDYWPNSSGYGNYGFISSSAGNAGAFTIGSTSSTQNIAYLDDVRLTVGQPVYTKNFTPPNRKLSVLRGAFVARSYQALADFSYPPDPKPDDLILHGLAVTDTGSSSGTLQSWQNEIGNWANNTVQANYLRINFADGTTTHSNTQPEASSGLKSGRLAGDEGGIFYFKSNYTADSESYGWSNGHRWGIGTELNDYIANQNGGSGIFDWTIEVGFKSSNTDHWMVNSTTNEGQKFPYNTIIEYEGGLIRTASANTTSGREYTEGMEVKHGSNHPALDQWENFESNAHRHILRIESPLTEYSVDSSGNAGNNDQAKQWIVLSAARENSRQANTSSNITKTRHLTLRGYRKLGKNINDLPHRVTGQGTVEYVYDGFNVDDQGGMSTGNMSLRSNTVPVTVGPLKLDTWHHAAIGYKASTKRLSLFLDGNEVAHEILENAFDWGTNGLQDTSDGLDSSGNGPGIFLGIAMDTVDVKFTARAKYDSRGYELPVYNHAGFGIDGPPYQKINPVDGSILPTTALQVENQLGFDGTSFRHWNVRQNYKVVVDHANGLSAMNKVDSWYATYTTSANNGRPSDSHSNPELATFLTARYENIIDHANNDYFTTKNNRDDNLYNESGLNNDYLHASNFEDYRTLKANSAMAIEKNDNRVMGGYGAFYFANNNVEDNSRYIKPFIFDNVYPDDHVGALMIDMWFGMDHTENANSNQWFINSNTGISLSQDDLGEVFRMGPYFSSTHNSEEKGSLLQVGVHHVTGANNSYWYIKWQNEMFYSHSVDNYSIGTSSQGAGSIDDAWGNQQGLNQTELPANNGDMFSHLIQVPFAFTDYAGHKVDQQSGGGTDVANSYGYSSEPDWWYLPYANSSGGTVDPADYSLLAYRPDQPRSNTVNTSVGEMFTMLRQPYKASRKDTSVCDWSHENEGMHHIKAGMDEAGWLYLYVDGVLLIRVHVATYYAKKYNSTTSSSQSYQNRMKEYGNHVTEDGRYCWNRPYGTYIRSDGTQSIGLNDTAYKTNTLRIGSTYETIMRRPAFVYQDIRISNNNIDSSQIHIPYVRQGLPKPSSIVYGGAEPDANNVVFHLVPGGYPDNKTGDDAVLGGTGGLRNYGWNANYNGDSSEQMALMGVTFTSSTSYGVPYGKFSAPDGSGNVTNPVLSQSAAYTWPNTTFYNSPSILPTILPYGDGNIPLMPQLHGGDGYCVRFKGANNGSSDTNYPSPNRIFCEFPQDLSGTSSDADTLGDEWTIEMWIYPHYPFWVATNAYTKQILFDSRSASAQSNPVIILHRDGDEVASIQVGDGSSANYNYPNRIVDTNYPIGSSNAVIQFNDYFNYSEDPNANAAWQHVAVVKRAGTSANNIGIFVNGVEVGGGVANSTVNSGLHNPSFTSFYLGDDYSGENTNKGYAGGMANVRVSGKTIAYNNQMPGMLGMGSEYSNMAKIKGGTPAPAIAEGKYSESLDFYHNNSTAPVNGKNGEYLEIYANHLGTLANQDHTQSKWMWANTTHSNLSPFYIASVAQVTANPDLDMSSDFTIEMWLKREETSTYNVTNPNTDDGEYDTVIGSYNASGFKLLISNWSQRYITSGHSQGYIISGHGEIKVMQGSATLGSWGTDGGSMRFGEWVHDTHAPGGGIPEKQWFHLALTRKGDKLSLFIDGVRHRSTSGDEEQYPGKTYNGNIEFSNPWYIGVDASTAGAPLNNRNNPWGGQMEDLRIINGECIYEDDFRPPQKLKRNTFSSDDLIEMVVKT